MEKSDSYVLCSVAVINVACCDGTEGRGYGSANGEKGGSSSRERAPYESGRGTRRRGVYIIII